MVDKIVESAGEKLVFRVVQVGFPRREIRGSQCGPILIGWVNPCSTCKRKSSASAFRDWLPLMTPNIPKVFAILVMPNYVPKQGAAEGDQAAGRSIARQRYRRFIYIEM